MITIIKKLLREGLISEKSIIDVSIKDFNVKGIMDSWLMSSNERPVSEFKYSMQDDYDMSDEEKEVLMNAEIDDVLESDRFKKWLEYEVEYRIEDFIDSIKYYFDGEYITIWRKMTVDQKWLNTLPNEGKRLGIYWSFEEEASDAHWGHSGDILIQLQTTINEKYIDWNQTIEANINLEVGEEEKEITLFKNTPLKIDGLIVSGKELDITSIKDKTFKA